MAPGATPRVLLLGGGCMGRALLAGWLARGIAAAHIGVVDPYLTAGSLPEGVRLLGPDAAVNEAADICVVAVKPQVLDEVLPGYQALARRGVPFLSIAAGKPLAVLDALLGGQAAAVRAMPNTPSAIGRGISAMVANGRVGEETRRLAEDLMRSVGSVVWLEDEGQMDAVTALSGSGPAYVFYLAEAMARAGVALGLPEALAARLARETVGGAGALLTESHDDPETLRRTVTSPGGTTAAALDVLMNEAHGLVPLMGSAMQAAALRSRDLAG